MSRFRWDRERPEKELDKKKQEKPSFIIRKYERGSRESTLKHRATISCIRRKAPITLAGQYWSNANEP